MTRLNNVRTIALFEFVSTLKRKGYLIATFGMPVLLLLYGGLIWAVNSFTQSYGDRVRLYGIVDQGDLLNLDSELAALGEIPAELRRTLEEVGRDGLLDGPLAIEGRAIFRPFPDEASARAALLEGAVAAYYLLPADFLQSGKIDEYRPNKPGLPTTYGARGSLRSLILEKLLEGRVSDEIARRLRDPIADLKRWTLNAGGEPTESSAGAVLARLVVPVGFTILLFLSLMMSAGYLIQGTAVEKENKVVEVILASVNPEEILLGKLFGLGGAGLLQVAVWFGMIILGGTALAATLAAFGVEIPWYAMGVGWLLFLLGYFFLGSLMLGVGSLGSNQRESQQLAAVWTLPAVLPLTMMGFFIQSPHHPVALVMTWIPFTAPVMVLVRVSLDANGIAWWEIAGSVAVLSVSIWGAIRLGARLFRVGLLLTGARPKLREIWRQARLG